MSSGGDIKNAVIKAAVAAAAEPGPDIGKRIEQRHFESAMEEVISARSIMQQSLFSDGRVEVSYPLLELQDVARRIWISMMASLGLATVALVVSLLALWLAYFR